MTSVLHLPRAEQYPSRTATSWSPASNLISGMSGGFQMARVLVKENLGVIEFHLRRDAASDPVMDALRSAVLIQAEKFSNFRRPTKALNGFLVGHDRFV